MYSHGICTPHFAARLRDRGRIGMAEVMGLSSHGSATVTTAEVMGFRSSHSGYYTWAVTVTVTVTSRP